jgi:manganese/zinc/iron transport system permease protein
VRPRRLHAHAAADGAPGRRRLARRPAWHCGRLSRRRERSIPVATLAAAAGVGIVVAWLVERLQSLGRVAEDASLGIVFTSLFALGVLLIHRISALGSVDLDPGCVLFGALELAAVDFTRVGLPGLSGYIEMPRPLVFLTYGLVVVLAALALLWKEWKLASFDAPLAQAMGFHPRRLHYVLMALASVVAVVSFESVGTVLVVAMMIVPPATARLLVDGYGATLSWSAAIAILDSVIGHAFALSLNVNEAGACATVGGIVLAMAAFFGPRHGFVVRAIRRLRLALDVAGQDVLARLFREEEKGAAPTPLPAAADWRESLARRILLRRNMMNESAGVARLTPEGRDAAQSLVRAHRLWESYLEQNFALPTDHLHEPAHRIEHVLDPVLQKQVQEELHSPEADPHGRSIPKSREEG